MIVQEHHVIDSDVSRSRRIELLDERERLCRVLKLERIGSRGVYVRSSRKLGRTSVRRICEEVRARILSFVS
jgi:hypothetical protein